MLVICGSATNWIINKLFKQKGGLYNRANSKMYLSHFTLAETEQYLQKQGFEMERYDIAQIYMIMGGIPYYLKQLEPGRPLADNIDNCFFRKNGKLWDEFEHLYETLFDQSELYLRIVEALSSKRVGLTRDEIVTATKHPENGKLSKALKDLVKCGFIRDYNYFGKKTTDVIGEEIGQSGKQVQRFIRLNNLIPEIMDMVDEKKIAFNPAVELSYLKPEEQREFLEAMDYAQTTPSVSQAQRIKKLSQQGQSSLEAMCEVMDEAKKPPDDKLVIKSDVLRKYFPKSYTPQQMEAVIMKLLEQWMKKRSREQER